MASTDEIQAKVINPMRSLFRVPFGIDDPEQALVEYTKALKNVPGEALSGAWERIVAIHKRRDWPAIADLLEAVGTAAEARASRTATPAGAGTSTHPARINPPYEVTAANLYESGLRNDPKWKDFLNQIHPTAEHNFFVQAEKVGNGIEVPNDFRREYIVNTFGESMKKHFGSPVIVRVNTARKFRELPVSVGGKRKEF